MSTPVNRLRSVADEQHKLLKDILSTMTPNAKAQVAAVTASITRTLCTVAADILTADPSEAVNQPVGESVPDVPSIGDVIKKFIGKNQELQEATANGDWKAVDRLTDSYVESLQKSFEAEVRSYGSGDTVS